jgi:hypothetical protein
MDTRICKRCGVEQPVDNFRTYYGRSSGRYTYCKTCERIEARRKYLKGRGDAATPEQREELQRIEELYEARVSAGLAAPNRSRGTNVPVDDLVTAQLNKLKEKT